MHYVQWREHDCAWMIRVQRESRRFKGEQGRQNYVDAFMQLHASVVLEIFMEGKTNMTDSWLPRDTAWCFMEALCLGSLNTFKTSAGKSFVKTTGDWDDLSHFFMEPTGCRPANYDWPKERVAAGHLWPWMASSGPASSIKQGQNGRVYETEHRHIQYQINKRGWSQDEHRQPV